MPRTDLYIKVVLQHEEGDKPDKLAAELCRMLQRHYNVRTAEVSNLVPQE
jgi:hypothetical protein